MRSNKKIWEAVKASLIAEGIQLTDKEKAIKSLSRCVQSKICIRVYLENFMARNEYKEGEKVWTNYNNKWELVTLIKKIYCQCQGGVAYITSPPLGSGGGLSIDWFYDAPEIKQNDS